jgi:hypothetical protein
MFLYITKNLKCFQKLQFYYAISKNSYQKLAKVTHSLSQNEH